jgi:oligogalacturonide transporter
MAEQKKRLGIGALVSYGMGDIYGGGSFLIISTLFIYFLTDVVGLSPLLAGLVVLVGKAWDAVSDPLMGLISDRTKSRFGRRRVYFLVSIIPVFLSFWMLWLTLRFENELATFFYYLFSYVLFCTVYTIVMVPYSSLPTEMSGDYRERARLSGARMLFSQLSALIAGTIPGFLVKNVYRDNPSQGFFMVGLIFGLLYALPWIIVFMGTWEEDIPTAQTTQQNAGLMQSFKDLRSLLSCRSFRLHIGMYLLGYTALDILSASFVYFVTYYIGRGSIYTLCLGSMLIFQLLSLPLHITIANRIGKGKSYAIGAGIVFLVAIFFITLTPASPTILILASSALLGLGLSPVVAMPWAMLPESSDADELTNHIERAGSVAGVFTLCRKLVQALTLWVFGLLLQAIGYTAGATHQSGSAIQGIRYIFVFGPLLFIGLGTLLAILYPITPKTFALMRKTLEASRAGQASPCTELEEESLKRITGKK